MFSVSPRSSKKPEPGSREGRNERAWSPSAWAKERDVLGDASAGGDEGELVVEVSRVLHGADHRHVAVAESRR